jgi:acyl-CoA reductase-like NAD-dependent aldehyde dehydrogenase
MPFGGSKQSGYGRFGGKAGIARIYGTPMDHHSNRPRKISDLSKMHTSINSIF